MSKPWQVKPFDKLQPVQAYAGNGEIKPRLCESCLGNSSRLLFSTADNRALDLCLACAEEAYKDGAFTDRWPLDNIDMLKARKSGNRTVWYTARAYWKNMPADECKDGLTYQGA